jgi:hypothetical protein
MDELGSPAGSLAIAIAALLLVLGFRLARPARAREWASAVAYAAGLVVQALGAAGLLPGGRVAPGVALRLAGAGLVVGGILLAGKRTRDRRRGAPAAAAAGPAAADPVHAGLALVLVGQLLRGPSLAGAVAVLAALAVVGFAAATPRRASA